MTAEQRRPPPPPLRVRHPSLDLAKRYDELIDVPMQYWTSAGEQWRKKVLEARAELNRTIGMIVEEDHARRQTS